MSEQTTPLNENSYMYYQAVVFKKDNSHANITKVMKIKEQFKGKRAFIKLVEKQLEKGDYIISIQGNLLNDIEDKDIILKY